MCRCIVGVAATLAALPGREGSGKRGPVGAALPRQEGSSDEINLDDEDSG